MLFLPITIAIITTFLLQATALPTKRASCDSPCVTILLNFNNYVPEPWVITLDGIPDDFTTGNATDVSKILVESAQDASASDVNCMGIWTIADTTDVMYMVFTQENPGLTPAEGIALITMACSTLPFRLPHQANISVDIQVDIEGQAQPGIFQDFAVDGVFVDIIPQQLGVESLVITNDATGDVRCGTWWQDGAQQIAGEAFSIGKPGVAPKAGVGLAKMACGLLTGN